MTFEETRPDSHRDPKADSAVPLEPGDVIPRRELTTIRRERVVVPAPDALTHLQFRRFAACPICNVHLRDVARRHDEITAAGVVEIVFFHSSVEAMLPHQGQLPFAAIADPQRRLYDEFAVRRSVWSVLHPRAWTSAFKPAAWSVAAVERRSGGRFGAGDTVLGLPADFLLDADGRIVARKYGKHANDQWSVDELLTIARSAAPAEGDS